MRTLTLVMLGIILLGTLFQCCPCAVLESTPIQTFIEPFVEEPTATPAPTKEPAIVKEPAAVMAYCDMLGESPVYVEKDQPVIIRWAWLALTPELIQEFITATRIEVLLDGREVKPETQTEIEYDAEEEGYFVGWSANVGVLAPGSHRVEYHASWSRQISDGWSTFGPGGEVEERWSQCEIIVE